jgi:hypothetical protein
MTYQRMAALISAANFWDKVSHDGRVALGSKTNGYPLSINGVQLSPGLPFSSIGPIPGEEDCTHFISCCIGQAKAKIHVGTQDIELRGGGLPVPQPFKDLKVYGETYAPRLVYWLKNSRLAKVIGTEFWPTHQDNTRQAILQNLQPGDLLAYASRDHPEKYEHLALLVGPTGIACHTRHRFGKDYTDVYFPWVTLLKLPG